MLNLVLYLVLLLVLAAFGLLVTALVLANTAWAWGSVAASLVAGGLLLADWLRRRRQRADVPPTAVEPAPEDEPVPAVVEPERAAARDAGAEPSEEDSDAADVLTVSELKVEVRVVDEHPRYHLSSCGWLAGKSTLGLPVQEARELGFTPCALCTPDAVLAAKHRATRS